MAKRRVGRYPRAFRQMAVDRLRKSDNVVVLSEELGVHRRLLYKWRKQLEPTEPDGLALRIRGSLHLRRKSASSSAYWPRRCRRWTFSKVPCKKSRLDAGRAKAVAR